MKLSKWYYHRRPHNLEVIIVRRRNIAFLKLMHHLTCLHMRRHMCVATTDWISKNISALRRTFYTDCIESRWIFLQRPLFWSHAIVAKQILSRSLTTCLQRLSNMLSLDSFENVYRGMLNVVTFSVWQPWWCVL